MTWTLVPSERFAQARDGFASAGICTLGRLQCLQQQSNDLSPFGVGLSQCLRRMPGSDKALLSVYEQRSKVVDSGFTALEGGGFNGAGQDRRKLTLQGCDTPGQRRVTGLRAVGRDVPVKA